MRRVALALGLALLLSPAWAEDSPVETPKPLTAEQTADRVLVALEAKDAEALKALAAQDEPDPWLVADELCFRGKHDAAEAFAKAAPRVDVERLPAYVDAWREREPNPEGRVLLAAVLDAMRQDNPATAVEKTGQLGQAGDGVMAIRLAYVRGVALRKTGRLEESAAVLQLAAEAAHTHGWVRRAYRLHGQAAESAWLHSDWGLALTNQLAALAIAKRRSDRAGAAGVLANIGLAHYKLGDYAQALSYYEQALGEMTALGDRANRARTLLNVGNAHSRMGAYADALVAYENAVAEQEALGDRDGVARTLISVGGIHFFRGDHDKALAVFQGARRELAALGDGAGAAKALNNIGAVHFSRGAYEEALAAYQGALEEKEALGDRAGAAGTLTNLGNVRYKMGAYAAALSMHESALEVQQALGDRQGAASTLVNIGNVHAALGSYAKALSCQERALAEFEGMADRAGAATTLGNIGNLHAGMGAYAKAHSFLERALVEQEKIGDRAGAAGTMGNIGTACYSRGSYAESLSYLGRALAEQEALGDRAGAATTLNSIGLVHTRLGAHERALGLFQRALAEHEALGSRAGVADSLGSLGNVCIALGDYAAALSFLRRALVEHEALGNRGAATHALSSIGATHQRLGNLADARLFLERATRAARRLRVVPVLVFALRELAAVYIGSGAPGRALGASREALREVETLLGGLGEEQGALAREAQSPLFAIGALAAVRVEDAAEAVAFLESGRAGALLDALGKREALRWQAASLPPELLAAEREAQGAESVARHAYDRALEKGDRREAGKAARALDDATDRVREMAGRIQREMKAQAGLFYPRAEPIETIQLALEEDQALVLYGLCLDEALALVLRQDGERIVALGTVEEVTAACEALDASDPAVDPSKALAALKALLVDKLELGEDVKQVLISPEGPLCYLPFAALFERTVTMTPSGSTHVLLLDEEREAGTGILALGDPDYDGVSEGALAIYYRGRTLSPLPATRPEVEQIGSVKLLGAEASEASLREELPKTKRWKAVHFACHGLIDVERPMLSSLALSRSGEEDGFLTALEVLRMKIPADLAVLSACETGKGRVVKGEGIVGLTRAFMFAGSPRVIASLWKVDDEATQALMIKFYELWNPKDGAPGLPAAEALHQAQAFIRAQEKWKHPYYWAAWVLWGLPK